MEARSWLGVVLIVAVGAVAAACSGAQPAQNDAAGVALNVGMNVAAAPLHRAVTGCYTQCAYGTVCNEKTGVCVGQEGPAPPVASAFPEGSPSASASAGPALAPAPTGVAPLCSPPCPIDHACEMEAGRSICKRL